MKNKIKKSNHRINDLERNLGKFTKPKILEKISNENYSDLTIAIKSPSPKNSNTWGDYFFSLSLKKSFEKKGFNVVIHEREEWYSHNDNVDINLVLRGLIAFKPTYDTINIIWNISHPDMVNITEFNQYDVVFIASEKYANIIKQQIEKPVFSLLQCTDPDIFFKNTDESLSNELLFVGITRGIFREIVNDVLKTNHNLAVYGKGWEKYISKEYIKGDFIPNKLLHKYYSSCKILFNDHWNDMKKFDFPSNRLFDALACETFVISDYINSANAVFEGAVVTYDSVDDLNDKINYYLENEDERIEKAKKGKEIVLKNHTFDNRVNTIINCLKNLDMGVNL